MRKVKIVRREIPAGAEAISGLPEFISRIFLARGVSSANELELGLKELHSNETIMGIDSASRLLVDAITQQKRILVVGDFDADGATSTALAVLAIRKMGADFCDYLVPNRFEYGYGLTPEIVDLAASKTPDLIVTVDNGISSIDGVSRAKELGIKVLITDHHLPSDTLPDADAIVNPNQLGCDFESKNAAGVGVIFYTLSKVRSDLRAIQWFETSDIPEPNMAEFLDLVALGTVADLVPLDRNNRILVSQGLRRIQSSRCRPGIRALLEIAGRKLDKVSSSDMGFFIGPRLNAAGRLDDMSKGIECLLAEDITKAQALASNLDQLNQERKRIEQEMRCEALDELENLDIDNSRWGICLYQAHWHQGVIGIVASRVKEQMYRPTIVFAPESDDPHAQNVRLKGSARSIPGFHMRDALDLIAKRNPHLLSKFGGHAMAAGMTIELENYESFCTAFDQIVKEVMNEGDLEARIYVDGELNSNELNLGMIERLNQAGPWGQQFPEPVFEGAFNVVQSKLLKDAHLKLVLSSDDGEVYDAIQFNSEWSASMSSLPEKVRVAYRPDINEFRGRRSVQLILNHLEALG